ncbi:MAG: bifunctional oligoribonuclease/PAP phosphatase NrnA [Phycisphaerae bacterium]|nr:bifunctional oligoribonuclease/PAP phosphatase NrnA [Phycisphaerae bacterium]MCZ2400683.1 bifunctional oligoribonuclease/PAP phosphatase NrnA [Phycisphaerae bacterium]NUQ49157.1 bifunctional oligoribonuclease/PAP phosphatase NrnA [Phycisphaerae bacterium]
MDTHVIDHAPPALAEALQAIRSAKRVALIGHVTPDADSLGAMAGLWLALPELGKHPFAALPTGTVSRRLEYLVRHAGMRGASPADLQRCDLAITLDTARDRRVNVEGKLESLPGVPVLNIDHHSTNTGFGRWNWVEPQRSSTSEMVYELLLALGCQLTPTVATVLYAGIHSDTHGFSLSNTTARSLEVAHRLAASGARVHEVCERLNRSLARGEFELLKVIFANTRVSPDGRLAWSSASHDEIVATGCGPSDVDDQVEVPRRIEGIRAALLFTEGDPGKVRINFRGEGPTDVLALAQQFGGGGHRSSAGAMLSGSLADVMERVVPAAMAFVAGLPEA